MHAVKRPSPKACCNQILCQIRGCCEYSLRNILAIFLKTSTIRNTIQIIWSLLLREAITAHQESRVHFNMNKIVKKVHRRVIDSWEGCIFSQRPLTFALNQAQIWPHPAAGHYKTSIAYLSILDEDNCCQRSSFNRSVSMGHGSLLCSPPRDFKQYRIWPLLRSER